MRIVVFQMAILAVLGLSLVDAIAEDDADTCARSDNLDEVISSCSRAIESLEGADLAAAYRYRGVAHRRKFEYALSIADFDEAIRLKPDFAKAFAGRCMSRIDNHDYDRAIADCDQAIRIEPSFVLAFINRAVAYRDKGNHERAIADLDAAIRIKPTPKAYELRATEYSQVRNEDGALSDFNMLIRLDPGNALALLGRAASNFNKGNMEAAISDATQAITGRAKLKPHGLAHAYRIRGWAYLKKGEVEKARADIDEALRLDPNSEEGLMIADKLRAAR